MKRSGGVRAWLEDVLSEDDPGEPFYDPVHVGGAILVSLAAIGALYWLLWTLLVFEGGIQGKLAALARLAFTSATLKDLGYEGAPYAMGAFEGWLGNTSALLITAGLLWAMTKLYRDAARARR